MIGALGERGGDLLERLERASRKPPTPSLAPATASPPA